MTVDGVVEPRPTPRAMVGHEHQVLCLQRAVIATRTRPWDLMPTLTNRSASR